MDIGKIGALVGLLATVGGVVFYISQLDSRLVVLENQMRLLIVAPSIQASTMQSESISPSSAISIAPNPIANACADLAGKAAMAAESGSYNAVTAIRNVMSSLGCSGFR
jgi:hypothetical protein